MTTVEIWESAECSKPLRVMGQDQHKCRFKPEPYAPFQRQYSDEGVKVLSVSTVHYLQERSP
jgi:hypothetical protein